MSGLVGYGSSDDEEEDVGKVINVDPVSSQILITQFFSQGNFLAFN